MKIVGERLRTLRDSIKLSQTKLANIIGTTQACINRYETDVSSPPLTVLLWYADYFDISLDYILDGRTSHKESCMNTILRLKKTARKCGSSLKCALTLIRL